MVVIVTRNVPDRFRGFLTSCALEIAPGVYTGPGMTKGVRERIWTVLEEWWTGVRGEASIVMTWQQADAPGGQGLKHLGLPPHEFVEYDGTVLIRRQGTEPQPQPPAQTPPPPAEATPA